MLSPSCSAAALYKAACASGNRSVIWERRPFGSGPGLFPATGKSSRQDESDSWTFEHVACRHAKRSTQRPSHPEKVRCRPAGVTPARELSSKRAPRQFGQRPRRCCATSAGNPPSPPPATTTTANSESSSSGGDCTQKKIALPFWWESWESWESGGSLQVTGCFPIPTGVGIGWELGVGIVEQNTHTGLVAYWKRFHPAEQNGQISTGSAMKALPSWSKTLFGPNPHRAKHAKRAPRLIADRIPRSGWRRGSTQEGALSPDSSSWLGIVGQ